MKIFVPALLMLLAACAGPQPAPSGPDELAPDFGQPGEADYHLFMAEIALQRDQPALAATEYLRAARASDDPEIAARATRIAAAYGTRAEGRQAARRWAELAPDDLHPRRYLARLYLQEGDIDAAARELALLRSGAEGTPRPFLELLALVSDLRDAEGALAAMSAVVNEYPGDASGAYAQAYLALRAGDVSTALAQTERAVELEPGWTDAIALHARALLADGRPDEALAWLAARPEAKTRELQLERAVLLMAAERNDEAREALEDILLEHPMDPDALRALGILAYFEGDTQTAREALLALLATGRHTNDALFYLGGVAEQMGEIEEAARLYSRVTAGEHLLTVQVRLALLMYSMGRPELAINHLELFAQRNPDAALELGAARAELLTRLGRPDDALAVYDELLAREPGELSVLYARGLLHVELGRVEEAVADFSRMVELRPDDPIALNALGYTLTDMTDRHDEAYPLIRRALELDPDSPAILDSMGWVLFKLGRAEEGLPYIERSWQLFPDAEIAAHRGELLWSLGRIEEARQVWLDAIVDFEGSQVLLDTMGRLDP